MQTHGILSRPHIYTCFLTHFESLCLSLPYPLPLSSIVSDSLSMKYLQKETWKAFQPTLMHKLSLASIQNQNRNLTYIGREFHLGLNEQNVPWSRAPVQSRRRLMFKRLRVRIPAVSFFTLLVLKYH